MYSSVRFKNEQQCFVCEGKILACKINKPGLITILYLKNSNEECFIRFKIHACEVLLMFLEAVRLMNY